MVEDYLATDQGESADINKQTIMLMKPSGINKIIGGFTLPHLVEAMLVSAGLSIREKRRKQLTEQEVRRIYPILNMSDPVYGDTWKALVIEHLTSEPVLSYLIEGDLAVVKAKIIKNHVRRALLNPLEGWYGRIVENFAHVSDEEDFDDTYQVFF